MHEAKIIKGIFGEIKKKAKGRKVSSVVLEVGELAPLEANELKGLMQSIADFKVRIKPVKAKVKCGCSYEGAPKIVAKEHDFSLFECPRCGKTPEVVRGGDIVLKMVQTV